MPVLAAVQGGCIGGGVDMVSACDCRYATADAFFCIQEINIGMTADVGTLQRLPKLIPEGIAREYAYTGRRLSAARAVRVGLVNEVFDTHDELIAGRDGDRRGDRGASRRSPSGASKEMINYARDHSVADGLNYIATWQTGMFQPTDMTEAFVARAEKRDAALRRSARSAPRPRVNVSLRRVDRRAVGELQVAEPHERRADPPAHRREVLVERGAVGEALFFELVGAFVGHLDRVLGVGLVAGEDGLERVADARRATRCRSAGSPRAAPPALVADRPARPVAGCAARSRCRCGAARRPTRRCTSCDTTSATTSATARLMSARTRGGRPSPGRP